MSPRMVGAGVPTIAFCSTCRAPVKPHRFDPSYSDREKCVLCGEGPDHPVHKAPADG